MTGRAVTVAATIVLGAFVKTTFAQMPTAIVEDVQSVSADVSVFQYLAPGRVVLLGRSGVLILGYLRSCLRETIQGGEVLIGEMKSVVKEGSVQRELVECDGGQAEITAAQAGKSGVIVFRRPDGEARPLQVYSAHPLFTFSDPVSRLVIKRLDLPDDIVVLDVTGSALDLAEIGNALKRGALYEAYAGGKSQVFEVHHQASAIGGPFVGRLVRL